ncbi:hypothetical protein CI109_100252 [Kwoniella shandongensis]|uniref:Uncharacterized protein n=1 Tax=Kwoniella shandongensis TaxID=1734106 RepID=A0A5M6BR82_9TREE|nr:uncharacterized protein CI109_006212 [Kwoniella shandongensis]KAA5525408.1 hypothetical protein CI109_006212 [Kwoniella shandongensis]
MLTLRSAARQSALRISRLSTPASTLRCDHDLFPHAESSSAAFRRHASSAASTATADSSYSQVNGGQGRSKEKKMYRPNPRLRRQAMANAKRLFEAIQSETAPISSARSTGNTPTSSTGSESNVSAASSSSSTIPSTSPSLADLLSKRPDTPPPNPWHPSYPRLHQKLHDSIDSAFVTKQMRSFAKDLGLEFGRGERMNKWRIVRKVMDSWGWVEPRERPEEKAVEENVFDLPAPELFLFLRDHDLVQQFIQDENVTFSVIPASEAHIPRFRVGDQRRMILSARGNEEALQNLGQVLQERKESKQTIEFGADEVHGLKANVELLQIVSNAAGAYVEPLSETTYRATAMSVDDAESAKRLLAMAALRTTVLPTTRPDLIVLPVSSHFQAHTADPNAPRHDRFSFYPFAMSLIEPLTWDQSALVSSQTMFRLRKVSQWTTKPARREVEHRQEDLSRGGLKATSGHKGLGDAGLQEENVVGLAESLMRKLDGEGKTSLKIRSGHLLFGVNPKDGSSVGTFDSPLPGQWPVENVQKWIGNDKERRPIFAPSLTPAMIQFPLSGPVQKVRKLQYRSVPADGKSKLVTFSHTLPTVESFVKAEEGDLKWQDQLGEMLDKMEKELALEEEGTKAEVVEETENSTLEDAVTSSTEQEQLVETASVGEEASEAVAAEEPDIPKEPVVIQAEAGHITEIDLFFPDRPTDLRLIATSTSPIAEDQIPEQVRAVFQFYADGSPQSARPPMSVTIHGKKYDIELDEEHEIVEEREEGVVRRCVKVIEQGLNGRPVTYTELDTVNEDESSTISPAFWTELASITRDVGPDAAALKQGNLFGQ